MRKLAIALVFLVSCTDRPTPAQLESAKRFVDEYFVPSTKHHCVGGQMRGISLCTAKGPNGPVAFNCNSTTCWATGD